MPLIHGLDLLNALHQKGVAGFLNMVEPFRYGRGPVPGILFFLFYKIFGIDHNYEFLLHTFLFLIILFYLFKHSGKQFGNKGAFFAIFLLASTPGVLNFWHQGFVEFILFFLISLAGYHFIKSDNFKNRKETILFSIYSMLALWSKLETMFFCIGPFLLILHALFLSKNTVGTYWKVNIIIAIIIFIIGLSIVYLNPQPLLPYLSSRMGSGGDISIELITHKFQAHNLIIPFIECLGPIVFALLIVSILLTVTLNLTRRHHAIPLVNINSSFLLFVIPTIPFVFFAGHSSIYIPSHIVVTLFFVINFITTLIFHLSSNVYKTYLPLALIPIVSLSYILCFTHFPLLGKVSELYEKPLPEPWDSTFQMIASSMIKDLNPTPYPQKTYLFLGCYKIYASKYQLDYHLKKYGDLITGETLEIWGDPEAIKTHHLPNVDPNQLVFENKPDFIILWDPMYKPVPKKDLGIVKVYNYIQKNKKEFDLHYTMFANIKTPIKNNIVIYKRSSIR